MSLAALGALLPCCANGCAPQPSEALSKGPPVATSLAAQTEKPAVPLPTKQYAEAIRRREFSRAAALIDAESQEERKQPEVRYARALVALELGDAETALRNLDGLEQLYPALDREAKLARDGAARKSRDLTVLEAFFGSSRAPEDALTLALASEQHGSPREAELRALEALSRLPQTGKERQTPVATDIHALLARLYAGSARPGEAAREYLWLAVEAPLADAASDADEKLAATGSKLKLSREQRMARAKSFSERGLVERTAHELEAAKTASGTPAAPGAELALLAFAYYNSRSDYVRAAALFAQAASLGDGNRKEYLYYEAKSLSRAHQDTEALVKYRSLALLGGAYGEHAAFQMARLAFLEGDYAAAIAHYESYGRTYKKARYESSWRAELPIARLASGQYAKAELELAALLDREKDELERARLLELLGVAAEGAGKTPVALARYREVIELRPLSYPALLAAARLRALGQTDPAPIALAEAQVRLPPLALELPDKVRRLHRVGLDELAEDALRAAEPALRSLYGVRSGEALCKLYGQLEGARRRYQIAQTAVSWSVLRRASTAESAWHPECIYPRPYGEVVAEEAKTRRVSASFLYGVMRQESAFRPSVVSPANAVGLMQIIPTTAQRIAKELDAPYEPSLMNAPAVNVRFGAFYLRKLLDMFSGRLELAAAAYNAGPQAVSRWLDKGEKLPVDLFVARIPYEETRNYVYRVLGNTARYAYQEGGAAAVPVVELMLPEGLRAPLDAY